MTAETTPDISILNLHDEPTVRDVDLGVRLGMAKPTNIRRTIERNAEELQGYGSIHAVRAVIEAGKGAQREITEYHLTEPQALWLCQLSRAPNAPPVRRMLIEAFMAFRNGATLKEGEKLRRLDLILKGWGATAFQQSYAAMGYELTPAMRHILSQRDLFARAFSAILESRKIAISMALPS